MTVVINGTTGITNPNSMTIGNGGGSVATNTAIGASALAANTTGLQSTAVGYAAGRYVTTANNITAFGYNAAAAITTGGENVAVGALALQTATTASENTAVGVGAMANTTTGGYNAAFGRDSLVANTTGQFNVAVGRQALQANTTTSNNTCVGFKAGYASTGYANTFVGCNNASNGAGSAMTTGTRNTILGGFDGNQYGLDIRTSSSNIVLSDGDGNPRQVIDSANNVMFGAVTANGLGVTIIPEASIGAPYMTFNKSYNGNINGINFKYNSTYLGGITYSNSAVAYNTTSDYRLKENIQPMVGALEKVSQLKPVTYTWKADGSEMQGFIAHELQAVVPDCVTGEKDAVDEDGNPVYQGIDTSFLVATLTAAIQELNAKVEAQAAEIAALKGQA